eukprot:gene4368-biopygen18964
MRNAGVIGGPVHHETLLAKPRRVDDEVPLAVVLLVVLVAADLPLPAQRLDPVQLAALPGELPVLPVVVVVRLQACEDLARAVGLKKI